MAQTDGAPLPEAAEAGGDPGAATDRLKAAIVSHGIVVEYAREIQRTVATVLTAIDVDDAAAEEASRTAA